MNQSIERDSTHGPQVFGHPRGLMTLFFTEAFERFTYYGMRTLLILFMTAAVMNGAVDVRGLRVGVVLSGGNIDLARFASLVGG